MAHIGDGPFSERKEVQTGQSDVSSKQSVNNCDIQRKSNPSTPFAVFAFASAWSSHSG